MQKFMDYILQGFSDATGWNHDNSYANLNKTANELLDFDIPGGLRLNLSSLATPQFATSYTLGSVGAVKGSLSYLYTSVPLRSVVAQSDKIPLANLLRSYRPLRELQPLLQSGSNSTLFPSWPTALPSLGDTQDAVVKEAHRIVQRPTLFYGQLYLPRSRLEALVVKRLSPSTQVQVKAVSEGLLRNGGTLLGILQVDKQQYALEGLASSDGALLGVRGLYNFGGDASTHADDPAALDPVTGVLKEPTGNNGADKERIYGRFSVGGEAYYGTLTHPGGVSMGARFATLPTYRGTPLTATMTVNPIMGTVSWTYAVQAQKSCSLATKFDFNVYSYESHWAVGMELWNKGRLAGLVAREGDEVPAPAPSPDQGQQPGGQVAPRRHRSFKAKMEWRLDDPEEIPGLPDPREWTGSAAPASEDEEFHGVLKARLDQNLKIGLLWEGRMKSLLFSLGTGVDLRKLNQPFRKIGLEIQFSS